jgi:NAD(P)-dependent dehydrogenase (short-subunit alcohol dehydrogenase family)
MWMIWRDVSLGTRPNRVYDLPVQAQGVPVAPARLLHEVADLALFLASPVAANITGIEVLIDGGQNKTL